jgi:hypothetical protein
MDGLKKEVKGLVKDLTDKRFENKMEQRENLENFKSEMQENVKTTLNQLKKDMDGAKKAWESIAK